MNSNLPTTDEESHLLGTNVLVYQNQHQLSPSDANSTRSHPQYTHECDSKTAIQRIRRLADFMAGLFVASAAFFMMRSGTDATSSASMLQQQMEAETIHPDLLEQHAFNRYDVYHQPFHKEPQHLEEWQSPYTKFQALGFQIYTGGAPAVLIRDNNTRIHNPECAGLNSYGRADDFDDDDLLDNLTLADIDLWECYLGQTNPKVDVQQRLEIMKDAVEKAHKVSDKDESTLKIFIAPEFFWRGKDGAYVFLNEQEETLQEEYKQYYDSKDLEEDCEEICHILKGLEALVANKKYKDWVFLFGTVIVSETLPKEDAFDYLFYNFAPLYKGYDPDTMDHYGKRFLVPKRYVSNIDFLTPVRQYNDSVARELFDITNPSRFRDEEHAVEVEVEEPNHDESTVVHNPFQMQRKFYDRDMWYEYKDELTALGYTMIEYDWLILDNITFSVEVCLDHDAQTALKAYLADKVLGSPTLIPKSKNVYNKHTEKYAGKIEYSGIPRHQAQLSLVSSSGMSVNPNSMALANNGTIILQDGLSSKEGSMSYESECEHFSWHFAGGSEHISRTAKLTETEISFQYAIHKGHRQVGIWDDLEDPEDTTWKTKIQGVFTTERYEPKITVYAPKEIAAV